MTQIATVERILDNRHAEISVPRKSACGHDCEECAGCGVTGAAVHATADNPIGAKRGDLVKVESSTAPVLKAAVVLYVLPLVLFFLGYWLGTLPGAFGALGGVLGFVLGVVIVVAYDRLVVNKANIRYTITAFADTTTVRKEEENHG